MRNHCFVCLDQCISYYPKAWAQTQCGSSLKLSSYSHIPYLVSRSSLCANIHTSWFGSNCEATSGSAKWSSNGMGLALSNTPNLTQSKSCYCPYAAFNQVTRLDGPKLHALFWRRNLGRMYGVRFAMPLVGPYGRRCDHRHWGQTKPTKNTQGRT